MTDVLSPNHDGFPFDAEYIATPEEVSDLNQSLRDVVSEHFHVPEGAPLLKNFDLPDQTSVTLANREEVQGDLIDPSSAHRIEFTWLGQPTFSKHTGLNTRRQLMWSILKEPREGDDGLQISDLNVPLLPNGKPAHVNRNKMVFLPNPTAGQTEIITQAFEQFKDQITKNRE